MEEEMNYGVDYDNLMESLEATELHVKEIRDILKPTMNDASMDRVVTKCMMARRELARIVNVMIGGFRERG